jgi:hypothetical protein
VHLVWSKAKTDLLTRPRDGRKPACHRAGFVALRCARDGYVCNYTVRFALSFPFALLIMLRMFSQS